jgi:hypothetical protein
MSDFQTTLAKSFATLSDVANVAHTASPLTALGLSHGDLTSVLGTRPTFDIGALTHGGLATPVQTPPPPTLTPIDAGIYIRTVAQTKEQAIVAAVHAARTAFEAIPTAQNGDVIDAAIPNGFRSALITLLSLADATIQQLLQQPRIQTAPPPVTATPPVTPPPVTPPVTRPPVTSTPPILVDPPIRFDPGLITIDPSVLGTIGPRPGVVDPASATPGGVVSELPTLNLGGRVFEAQTVTHPETGLNTTVFIEQPAAAAAGTAAGTSIGAAGPAATTAALQPVSGGGFHLTLDSPAGAGANLAAGGLGGAALGGLIR